MLKTYELAEPALRLDPARPRAASEAQVLAYLLDRALRAQGVVSLDSVCYLDAPRKRAMAELIERARPSPPARRRWSIEGDAWPHWIAPRRRRTLPPRRPTAPVHLLSPFDPLVIQRKRLRNFFGYEHRFEAYVPKPKRALGYFALPMLVGDRIVAAIDLKADRAARRLLIQQWTWLDGRRRRRSGGDRGGARPLRDLPVRRLSRARSSRATCPT